MIKVLYKNNKVIREFNSDVFGELVFEDDKSFKIHSSSTIFKKAKYKFIQILSLAFFFFPNVYTFAQNEEPNTIESLLNNISTFNELKIVLPYLDNTNDIPSIFPLQDASNYTITSAFGSRFHPIEKKNKKHNGIDVAAEIGTLVVATADGVVKKIVFSYYGHGRSINIEHKYGFRTQFSHLAIVLVKKNELVKKGQIIGMVGSTGKSTGNHLHYEVIKNKKNLNPSDFFFIDYNFSKI